jgi:hypothetical protein
MHIIFKRIMRWLVRAVCVFLPQKQAHALERWRRGREEYRKYRLCDYIFASYGKSGRTWVRVMISRYYQQAYALPERILMGFDNFHKINPAVPRIFYTHDNYLRGYTGNLGDKKDFYDKKVVLLVRRPQDVAVSQFFQWKYRMRPGKMAMNHYPPAGAELSVYDFVTNPDVGLPRIIDFMNVWAAELPRIRNLLLVRYEDLRSDTEHQLARIVEFLGLEPDAQHIKDAVEFATVENLRKMEKENYFWRSGSRVKAKDPNNPHSYKVRRAKVGGYRDYFDDAQLAEIDGMVDSRLSEVFGYHSEPAPAPLKEPAGEVVSGA